MKKFFVSLSVALALCLGFGACQKEAEVFSYVDTDKAFEDLDAIDNATMGIYRDFAYYRFFGRNVLAIGDMAGRTGVASASAGHFVAINDYTFNERTQDLDQVWDGGYRVIAGSVYVIQGAQKLLTRYKDALSDPKQESEARQALCRLYADMSQAYAMRAMSEFALLNIFAPPYKGHQGDLGIVLLSESTPPDKFAHVSRATVGEGYASVLSYIDKAIAAYGEYEANAIALQTAKVPIPFYYDANYFGSGAIYALQARVYLYQEEWDKAIEAGKNALQEQDIDPTTATPLNGAEYLAMWKKLSTNSAEHIFVLAKSEANNLSANALNTLYGGYEGQTPLKSKGYFAAGTKDIRAQLIGNVESSNPNAEQPIKWGGIPGAQAVSNIPIFRVSEVMLNLAECYLRKGDLTNAKHFLNFTAQRDPDVVMPSDASGLETLLKHERVCELFAEGFDFYDLRRWGETIDKGNSGRFDLGNFAYPIPSTEVNSGFGVVQNPDTFWSPK